MAAVNLNVIDFKELNNSKESFTLKGESDISKKDISLESIFMLLTGRDLQKDLVQLK